LTVKTKKVQKRLVESAKTNSKRVHITPRTNGWVVRREGNLQASIVVKSQRAAVEVAKTCVKSGTASSVIIHSKNGKFRAAR